MKKLTKNMKYSILTLAIVFGFLLNVKQVSAAWDYYQGSIQYTVTAGQQTTIGVTLSANPASMTLPTNSTNLTWTTSGSPDSCTADLVSGPSSTTWSGARSTASNPPSEQVNNLIAGNYVFRITCSKAGASNSPVNATALVVVNPAVTECSDGIDNADPEDSLADINDPGCHVGDNINNAYVPSDNDETNAPPAPSGTLSASGCTISSGGSGCSGSVSWTTANLTANPTAITRDVGSPSSFTPSPLSGGSQGTTLGYGQTNFFLYHNSVLLAQSSATTSCVSGTTWNGTVCQNNGPLTPSVTLNALPSTVFSGSAATLSWTSANVSSCTASASPVSGTWTGSRPTASTYPHESTGALTATTTFSLSCTGANGPASSSKIVTVVTNIGGNIIADLVATPDRINSGESSLLTWSSQGATSCSGIGFSTGGLTQNTSGVSVSPTVNTTYTLNCTDGTNSASDQASVTLKRKFFFIEF